MTTVEPDRSEIVVTFGGTSRWMTRNACAPSFERNVSRLSYAQSCVEYSHAADPLPSVVKYSRTGRSSPLPTASVEKPSFRNTRNQFSPARLFIQKRFLPEKA